MRLRYAATLSFPYLARLPLSMQAVAPRVPSFRTRQTNVAKSIAQTFPGYTGDTPLNRSSRLGEKGVRGVSNPKIHGSSVASAGTCRVGRETAGPLRGIAVAVSLLSPFHGPRWLVPDHACFQRPFPVRRHHFRSHRASPALPGASPRHLHPVHTSTDMPASPASVLPCLSMQRQRAEMLPLPVLALTSTL